jgi:hypothetical protein
MKYKRRRYYGRQAVMRTALPGTSRTAGAGRRCSAGSGLLAHVPSPGHGRFCGTERPGQAADTPRRAYLSGPGSGSVCSTVSRDTARVSAT